jgi:L-lactate dehydrogenase complex protein LldF
VPQRLSRLPAGERPRLPQRVSGAGRRGALAAADGEKFPQKADLPKASSLCGACNEVCPVNIPIPDLLLRLRNRAKEENVPSPGTPPMGAWALLASQPTVWKASLFGGKVMNYLPTKLLPIPALRAWEAKRALPEWRGGEFRKWLKNRPSGKSPS